MKTHTSTSYSRAYTQTVTADTYGNSIPISRGTRLIPGQIIWSTAIETETKTTTQEFEPESELVLDDQGNPIFTTGGDPIYETEEPVDPITNIEVVGMYVDCAIGFGAPLNSEVKANILQLRAGNTIIYDTTVEGGEEVLKMLGMTVYSGAEDQLPDPLMEGYLGAGNVPAYRGEIYVVFKQLDLVQFGGSFPTITALIADEITEGNPLNQIVDAEIMGRGMAVDRSRNILYWLSESGQLIYLFDARRLINYGVISVPAEAGAGLGGLDAQLEIIPWFNILLSAENSALNATAIFTLDAMTGEVLEQFGETEASVGSPLDSMASPNFNIAQLVAGNKNLVYVLFGGILGGIKLLQVLEDGQMLYAGHDDTLPSMDTACRGPVFQNASYIFTSWGNKIFRFDLTADLTDRTPDDDGFFPVPYVQAPGAVNPYWLDLGDEYAEIQAMHFYLEENVLIAFAVRVDSGHEILQITTSGTIVRKTTIANAGTQSMSRCKSIIDNGLIGWIGDGADIYDCKTGTVREAGSIAPISYNDDYYWDCYLHVFLGRNDTDDTLWSAGVPGALASRIPLITVLEETSLFVGITAEMIFIDPTITNEIDGLAIVDSAGADFWRMTKNWGLAFLFAVAESGSGISIRRSIQVGEDETFDYIIGITDLAMLRPVDFPRNSDDPFTNAAIITERKPDSDIYDYIELTYSDSNYDYHRNTYYATRARLPSDPRPTGNKLSISIPEIIMLSNEASSLCSQILFQEMTTRLSHRFRLPTKFSDAITGDLFALTLGAFSYKIKLTELTYHSDFSLSCVGTDYWSDVELISVEAQTPIAPDPQPVPNSTSQIIVFDTPMLSPNHEIGNEEISIYYGIGGYGQAGWQMADTFRSENGSTYEQIDRTTNQLVFGRATTKLEAPDNVWTFDEENEFQFYVENGPINLMVTQSTNNWYIGGLTAIIGQAGRWEVISIRECEPVAGAFNTFVCRGFIRGLRDTYMHAGSHLAGDRIVFPYMNGGRRTIREAADQYELVRYYKGVGPDQDAFVAPRERVELVAEAQRPMSVINYRAIKNSGDDDILISWTRQSRLAKPFQSSGPETIMNEFDVLRFNVLIRVDDIIQTNVSVLDAEEYLYTAAEQTGDGLTPGEINTLDIEIRQTMIVGEIYTGRSERRTVNVE